MQISNNIILIGMPAVGKSTLGVLLAKRIGFAFIDTDLIIQNGEKSRLQHIIHDRGIEAFCDLEAGYIQKLSAQHSVIATGGSVIYRSEAMDHLKAMGQIIFLDIKLDLLKERLKDMDTRGVIRPSDQSLDNLYLERRALYQQYAHNTVACSNLAPKAIVEALLLTLNIDNHSE